MPSRFLLFLLQMPQNALLKRQACFEFLLRHSRQTANEIKDEYVDTMSKVHTTYFKTYLHRLLKLQVKLRFLVALAAVERSEITILTVISSPPLFLRPNAPVRGGA